MEFIIVNIINLLSALGVVTLPEAFVSGILIFSGAFFAFKCLVAFIVFVCNKNKTVSYKA